MAELNLSQVKSTGGAEALFRCQFCAAPGIHRIAGAILINVIGRLLKDRSKVLNTLFQAIFVVGVSAEGGAKGQCVAPVPGVIDERVDDAAHAGEPNLSLS